MRNNTIYNAQWCVDAGTPLEGGETQPDLSRRWMQPVHKYSLRDLAFSFDKLVAIAGLASRTASCSGWDYLAGHWWEGLGKTLLWTAGGLSSIGGGSRHAEYQAPSWSWASLHGVEICANIHLDSSITLLIDEVSCTPRSEVSPFGAVRDGRLVVRGMMAPAKALERGEYVANGSWLQTRPGKIMKRFSGGGGRTVHGQRHAHVPGRTGV